MQDSLRFWIPRRGFRNILCQWNLDFRFHIVSGIPDSLRCIPDSKPRTPNTTAKICWIPDSTSKIRESWKSNLPDSGFPFTERQDNWDI